jgi:Fungal Zn(2)-Cys(6) binuclear cluster domain
MRACEGCRRRKIKCDAATTNTWPCSACIRLKLHCVPPTVNYDNSNGQGFEPERGGYESSSGDDEYQNQLPLQQHLAGPPKALQQQIYQQHIPYTDTVTTYHSLPYTQHPQGHVPMQSPMQFNSIQGPTSVMDNHYSSAQTVFPVAPVQQRSQPESPEYHHDRYEQQELADLLGDLKMDFDGSGKPTQETISYERLI